MTAYSLNCNPAYSADCKIMTEAALCILVWTVLQRKGLCPHTDDDSNRLKITEIHSLSHRKCDVQGCIPKLFV